MNREIKFRVWDKNKSQMSPVATISFGDDGAAQTVIAESAPKGKYYHPIVYGENGILMQYTGLKDKKGTEIYEDDILTLAEEKSHYQVYWNYDRWGLKDYRDDDYDSGDYYRGDDINNWHEWEVISNMYENPELLEKQA